MTPDFKQYCWSTRTCSQLAGTLSLAPLFLLIALAVPIFSWQVFWIGIVGGVALSWFFTRVIFRWWPPKPNVGTTNKWLAYSFDGLLQIGAILVSIGLPVSLITGRYRILGWFGGGWMLLLLLSGWLLNRSLKAR